MRAHFAEGVDEALLVLHVEPHAPAASAGILVGDLMLSFNGHWFITCTMCSIGCLSLKVGDSVPVVVIRGGIKMDLTVILADRG